jgi:hypothetical protein
MKTGMHPNAIASISEQNNPFIRYPILPKTQRRENNNAIAPTLFQYKDIFVPLSFVFK